MNCYGCYMEVKKKDFCPKCSKKLFGSKNISAKLSFEKPEFVTYINNNSKRFSISGVQDKASLKISDTQLALTDISGEYILKPMPSSGAIIRKEDVVANEHLTMQIAEQIYKFNTASSCLVEFQNGEIAYLVKRFDRLNSGLKLAQEDFCQLLNLTKETKGEYYKYCGSYLDAIEIFNSFTSKRIFEVEDYFKRILFNYAYHNGDAHFKNFSLIESGNSMTLTPVYDLLNTRLHSPHEASLALENGLYYGDMDSEFYMVNGFYSAGDFMLFSEKLNISNKRAKRFIDFIKSGIDTAIPLVEKSFLSDESKELYLKYILDRKNAFL